MPKPSATPPFRADHVGSLLRPKPLQEARAAWKAGTLSTRSCETWKTAASPPRSAKQQDLGLPPATDGEYRRAYWHFDFVAGLDGVEVYEPEQKSCSRAACRWAMPCASTAASRGSKPVMIDDYKFLASHVLGSPAQGIVPKQTIPSPSVVHFRGGRQAIDRTSIPRWMGSSPIWATPTTRRSRHLAPPAAAICNSTRSTSPISAIPSRSQL